MLIEPFALLPGFIMNAHCNCRTIHAQLIITYQESTSTIVSVHGIGIWSQPANVSSTTFTPVTVLQGRRSAIASVVFYRAGTGQFHCSIMWRL